MQSRDRPAADPPGTSDLCEASSFYRTEVIFFAAALLVASGELLAYGAARSAGVGVAAGLAACRIAGVCAGLSMRRCGVLILAGGALFLAAYLRATAVYAPKVAFSMLEDVSSEGAPSHSRSRGRYRRARISGCVLEPPRRSAPGEMTLLVEIGSAAQVRALVRTADVPWGSSAALDEGSCFEAAARLELLAESPPERSGLFSFAAYLKRKGISASGYLDEIHVIENSRRERGARERVLQGVILASLRQGVSRRDAFAVTVAATLGAGELLSEPLDELFRSIGITHVLVVSGLHIALAYLLVRQLVRALWVRSKRLVFYLPAAVPAAIAGVVGSVGYTFLTGGGLAAIRAALMLSFVAAGEVFGVRAGKARLLLCAFTVMSMVWPGAFLEAGFQLTFLALAGLLAASVRINERQNDPAEALRREAGIRPSAAERLRRSVVANALYSLYAWIFTLPSVLLWFGQLVPLAPLWNMLFVAPFCFFYMYAGALVLLLLGTESSAGALPIDCYFHVGGMFLDWLQLLSDLLAPTPLALGELSPAASNAAALGAGVVAFLLVLDAMRLRSRSAP